MVYCLPFTKKVSGPKSKGSLTVTAKVLPTESLWRGIIFSPVGRGKEWGGPAGFPVLFHSIIFLSDF